MRKHILKTTSIMLIIFLSICFGLFSGMYLKDESAHHLSINVTINPSSYTTIPSATLSERYPANIYLVGVSDVSIQLCNQTFPFEEAIEQGKTTIWDIIAQAHLDVLDGLCHEVHNTKHGITEFIYQYEKYEIHYIHDILLAPDQREHIIDYFGIYPRNTQIVHKFIDENAKIPYPLDREDWGLTFEILEVSPTGIKIRYYQSGGQQFGDLDIVRFGLYNEDYSYVCEFNQLAQQTQIRIQPDASGVICFDWTEAYDAIAPGAYFFQVTVEDIYDQSSVHPLTQNYYDCQSYYIPFTLP